MVVGVAKHQRADEDAALRLRMTAYHMRRRVAVPWIRCHGRGGSAVGAAMPASMSWRCVAT